MGIKKDNEIIIYDNSEVLSACRCWFNFIYFGHDPKLVHVLNGGLNKWITEKRRVISVIVYLFICFLTKVLRSLW